jgi:cell division protein FtsB
MTSERQQPFIRRFFASRMFLIVLLVVAVLLALNFARAYYQDIKIREEIRALEKEVSRLEQKKLESIDLLDYVTSKAFVEEKARTELNLRKPGERTVVVQNLSDAYKKATNGSEDEVPLGNPAKWWYYMTHNSIDNR